MSASPLARFLGAQGFVVLDGGLATALEAAGHALSTPLWSARSVVDEPGAVRAVHDAFLAAGADCISTAGYQASFEAFAGVGMRRADAEEGIRAAVAIAVQAKESFWATADNRAGRLEPIVAASAGPYGAFLADGSEYDGRYGVGKQVLERFHRERIDVLVDTAADVLAFETIPSLLEAEVLAELLGQRPDSPAWVSFSCRDSHSLWDGTPIAEAVRALRGVDALVGVGVNCTAPQHLSGLIDMMRRTTDLPIIVYPNSGERYDAVARAWVGPRVEWLDQVGGWYVAGARAFGGCCRVGPGEIRELRFRLEDMDAL